MAGDSQECTLQNELDTTSGITDFWD